MDLKLKIKQTIEEHDLITKGDKVLVGLSGGPDSLCLLHILNELKELLGFTLSAFHVNHMIREEADKDEAWLTQLCKEWEIPFESVKVDVPAYAKENRLSTEDAGRRIRREYLFSRGADKIAIAHNKNDQAETVLMRIIRGTGVRGLCAMEYKTPEGIIRPLLDTERDEIEKYCVEKKLNPLIDKTNFQTDYTRNKIRLEILPALQELNPGVIDALVRLADSAREDEKSIFARVVTTALAEAGLETDIGSKHINALYKATKKNTGGKIIEFPRGYKAVIKNGKVNIIYPKEKK